MRICVISPGVAHAVPRTVAFCRDFNDVHFIDMRGDADSEKISAAGIRYYRPDRMNLDGPRSLQLLRVLNKISPDLIVVHFCSGTHFFGAIAYGKCPVAGIVMGSDVLYERGDVQVPALARLLIRLGVRRLAYVSAKAAILADRCQQYGALNPITTNYWGADTTHFAPLAKAEARRELNLPENRSLILSPRALSPLYNIDVIIDAMRQVIQCSPDALLLIIGREVSEYRARLESLIADAELEYHVRICGPVSYDDIPSWYAASDLVLSMAKTEGFPNSVLEAMCCKRPVVVGRIPQIEDVLSDRIDCRLVEIDSGSIAKCVTELLADNGHALEIATAGYYKALDIANIDKNGRIFARELLSHYQDDNTYRSTIALLLYRAFFFVYAVQQKIYGLFHRFLYHSSSEVKIRP